MFSMDGLSTFLPESEITALKALAESLKHFASDKTAATLYYPGGGLDLMRPLAILDSIHKSAKNWRIVLQDPAESIEPIVGLAQAITGVIPHKISGKDWSSKSASFHFKDRDITIDLSRSDALHQLPPNLDSYDIYFDRAFEIVRIKDESFVARIARGLRSGGVAITDCGFKEPTDLERVDTKSTPWGFYKSPAVYRKRKD